MVLLRDIQATIDTCKLRHPGRNRFRKIPMRPVS
jgi:hypothetical protein